MKQFGFSRQEHLKRSSEIQTVFKKGRKITCNGAKLFVFPNGREINRIVFTFPRKYGNAVERNRSRRLSREVFRLVKNRMKTGFDLVLLVFPGKDRFCDRMMQVGLLLKKSGLWNSDSVLKK